MHATDLTDMTLCSRHTSSSAARTSVRSSVDARSIHMVHDQEVSAQAVDQKTSVSHHVTRDFSRPWLVGPCRQANERYPVEKAF
jgi:hypothetical protein